MDVFLKILNHLFIKSNIRFILTNRIAGKGRVEPLCIVGPVYFLHLWNKTVLLQFFRSMQISSQLFYLILTKSDFFDFTAYCFNKKQMSPRKILGAVHHGPYVNVAVS